MKSESRIQQSEVDMLTTQKNNIKYKNFAKQ